MNALSWVFVFKITATVLAWCVPLLFMPAAVLEALGFPQQETYMFVRMLGWAYLALCVGYAYGLRASLAGKRLMSTIWVGIVSNGGGCLYLSYYAFTCAWSDWGFPIQFIAWNSIVATFFITLGLFLFGVRGSGEAA